MTRNQSSAPPKSLPIARAVSPLGIIAEWLQALVGQAQTISSLPQPLRDELAQIMQLAAGLEPYVAQVSTPQSEALAALADATTATNWPQLHAEHATGAPLEQEMLSGHIEGQVLKMLVHAVQAKRVLEIGLFTGYSALAMAEALPDDGKLVALELDEYAAEFARNAFAASEHGAKIDVVVGPAINALKDLDAPFELIFIDADKGGYIGYLEHILDHNLITSAGLICVDNTLMQGEPYIAGEPTANGKAIASFNTFVAQDKRVEQVLLPVRDGLTLIRRVDR